METPLARLLALALAGSSGVALLACQGQTLDTSRPDSARAVSARLRPTLPRFSRTMGNG